MTIGLSALETDQRALEIIGNNIANASTPGYHRQVAQLVELPPNEQGVLSIGSGVDIADIGRGATSSWNRPSRAKPRRRRTRALELDTLQQIQTQLAPGDSDVGTLLESFFNQLEQLSSQPNDTAQRQIVLGGASALGNQFNSLASALDQTNSGIETQLNVLTNQVNSLTGQIAALNTQIGTSEARGLQVNDQCDQRDQLINQLANLVNVRTVEQPLGKRPCWWGVCRSSSAASIQPCSSARISLITQ